MTAAPWLRCSLALATVLFTLDLTQATVPKATQAPSELEGTWDGVRSIGGGKTRDFRPGQMFITFRGSVLTAQNFIEPDIAHSSGVSAAFELDPTKSPKHFDYVYASGKRLGGIYEISGDSLTIAFGAERPKGFKESDQSFRVSILQLKRRK